MPPKRNAALAVDELPWVCRTIVAVCMRCARAVLLGDLDDAIPPIDCLCVGWLRAVLGVPATSGPDVGRERRRGTFFTAR